MLLDWITRIGLLVLFVTIVALVFEGGTVIVCLLTGVKFKKVVVFFGKPVFTIRTRLAPISIGYIPGGGFVQLDMDRFAEKPLITRCFVTLAGPLALFLSSVGCLGIVHAGHSFVMTIPEGLEFLLSPAARGKQFMTLFFDLLQASPVIAYGVFAAKASAFHLFPIPEMSGGRLMIELTAKRDESVLAKSLQYFCTLSAIVLAVEFVVAVISFFRE